MLPQSAIPQTDPVGVPPADYPYGPKPALLPKDAPAPLLDKAIVPWLADAVAAGSLFGFCLLFNGVVPFVLNKIENNGHFAEVLGGLAVGIFAVQFGALSCWLVFGEARFWLRLPIAWLLGYSLGFTFLVSISWEQHYISLKDELRTFLCATPLVALAAQLPLWGAKTYFRWRIARPAESLAPVRPLSIGDILVGTAVTALTVAAVRFIPHIDPQDSSFWAGWAIAVPAVAGISFITILPALFFVLRIEDKWLGNMVYVCFAVLAIGVTLGIIGYVNRKSPPPTEAWIAMCTLFPSMAASLFGLLHLFRWLGHRLVFPGDHWDPGRS
jgi:hypothetical protein